ncbi:Poly A RNA polymerase cid11 [Taenia solium]|eukprot:TsM_000552800 transcript=TsM_000552800 gene=TsM_000552800
MAESMTAVNKPRKGTGLIQSDFNFVLKSSSKGAKNGASATSVLRKIMSALRQAGASYLYYFFSLKYGFKKGCRLIRAKVPLLKLHDRQSGIECGLNINNLSAVYNTRLLAMYARVDSRLRPLGMFVKHWARKMSIYETNLLRASSEEGGHELKAAVEQDA